MNRLAVVNLNDLYLTRIEYDRKTRRLLRQIKRQNLAIYILAFGIGMVGIAIYEDRKRLEKSKENLKKGEMAG